MTNLEWLAENECYLCQYAHLAKYGEGCGLKECEDCEFKDARAVVETLNKEHRGEF